MFREKPIWDNAAHMAFKKHLPDHSFSIHLLKFPMDLRMIYHHLQSSLVICVNLDWMGVYDQASTFLQGPYNQHFLLDTTYRLLLSINVNDIHIIVLAEDQFLSLNASQNHSSEQSSQCPELLKGKKNRISVWTVSNVSMCVYLRACVCATFRLKWPGKD